MFLNLKEKKIPLREDKTKTMYYVIGDVRGRHKKLTQMLHKIMNNPTNFPLAANDKIVIMGNFLKSKNCDSQEVMKLVKSLQEQSQVDVIFIRGGFEHICLKFRRNFLEHKCGLNFVKSYKTGIKTNSKPYSAKFGRTKDGHLDMITMQKDLIWLGQNTQYFLETKKFFICSSGLVSDTPIDKHTCSSLMFVRGSEIPATNKLEKILVHGNDLQKKVFKGANRISLDTEKVLSCTVLDDATGKVQEIITV